MAPRSRLRKNAGLPPNLYEQRGYHTYRHPVTKEIYGLGRDKARAVTQAIQANLHFQQQAVTLLDRITGATERTVADWCNEFEKLYGKHVRMKYLRDGLGHSILSKLEPLEINNWLDANWEEKPRMRQAMLSTAKVVFGAAIGKGWLKANPAADLTTAAPITKRARLTLDAFKAIYAKANPVLQHAMEIALMTGMRRTNVMNLQWSQVKEGYLWVEHAKKGLKVRVPLSMYLAAMKWTLGDVIGRCRTATVSRYLLHHQRHVGLAKPGDKIRDKTIEQLFREAREEAGINGQNPPTFHEIRSLAARLWKEQGIDVRVLLGHKTEAMSALYQDSRGAEWVTISG
ncbi:tyrosine-type recombinase/integrase [Oryzomicrobium sp.]|uniref:tyrosine-type recombinase/integrase n=1 Tax=Oryzomicrobium sp. TaxID=1911578 RepID=UPI002FE27658